MEASRATEPEAIHATAFRVTRMVAMETDSRETQRVSLAESAAVTGREVAIMSI